MPKRHPDSIQKPDEFDDPQYDQLTPESREHPCEWTKGELVDAAGVSPKTFDTIRKAARVKGPSHGGLKHRFSAMDLIALIQRVESGSFNRTGKPIGEAWRALLHEAGLVMPTTISRQRRD